MATRKRSGPCSGLLDRDFLDLPHDLEKKEREGIRRKLARHLVQRRRADIRHYLDADTAFPERMDKESTYTLGDEYRGLFENILDFARDYVAGDDGERHQRVRYWSALALLRCVSSSPAAAAATLRSRAAVDEADEADVDEVGRRTVLDQDAVDEVATLDFNPGSDTEDSDEATRRKLLEFARRAEALKPEQDHKLQGAIKEIKALVKDGFQPVVFCRFVDTAEYVAKQLREALPAKVRVESVTGLLPAEEREARIRGLTADGWQLRAGVHGLPVGRHQPAAPLQCHRALRPGLEPHAARATRGPGRPIRPAEAGSACGHLLRQGQPDRRRDPRRAAAQAQGHQERPRRRGGGAGYQRAGGRGAVPGCAVPREDARRRGSSCGSTSSTSWTSVPKSSPCTPNGKARASESARRARALRSTR